MLLTARAETTPNISLVLLVSFKENHHHNNNPNKCAKICFFELNKWRKVVKAPFQIQYMAFEAQAAQAEKGNKSYFPSLLITPSTIARLTTWQACLAAGISFLIWEAGAPEEKKKKKNDSAHELSHNVNVRKSNLACEIPISDSTMTTGSNHGRTLQWADQPILQSDRHAQTKPSDLSFTFTITTRKKSSHRVALCQVCFQKYVRRDQGRRVASVCECVSTVL